MATPRPQLAARRRAVGFSQESLAAAIGVTSNAVAKWEQGHSTPRARVRAPLADALEVTAVELDRLLDTSMLQTAAGHSIAPWLGHYASLEQGAAEVWTYEPLVVPALLQTMEYALAVETAVHFPDSPERARSRAELRMHRQQVLVREPQPLLLRCVIDESILHRSIGGRRVMAEQLRHLASAAGRPNIELHIAPMDGAVYGAAFSMLVTVGAADPYIACAEDLAGKRYHDAPPLVREHASMFEHLVERSLSPDDSLSLIKANGD